MNTPTHAGRHPARLPLLQPTSEPLPSLQEDFKREARLLQRCKDPHIGEVRAWWWGAA